MSEFVAEDTSEDPFGFGSPMDASFADLMDALVPDEADEAPAEGADQGGAAGDAARLQAPAGQGAADPAGAVDTAGAGATGEPAVPDAGSAPAGTGEDGAGSAAGLVEFSAIQADFGKMAVKIEERTAELHRSSAVEDVRKDFPRYFEALTKHPRMLAGQQVPSLNGEGFEVLRDASDAREWQDAVKHLLSAEVRDRASRMAEEDTQMLQVVHSSIELFQNNPDLVPGVRGFDKELATRFTALAQPYELRIDGKLNGYSIPVQPLITQVRAALAAERAAKAATPPATSPAAPGSTTAKAPAPKPRGAANGPQRGISAKAGHSGEDAEDFSTLFGTLGRMSLRI